jgi:hypothetical protein
MLWGGEPEDYLPVHQWFDASKAALADPRHRALRHHAFGIAEAISVFGPMIVTSTGREVPTRWIGEQHVREDFGHIPTVEQFLRHMPVEPWMHKGARKLSLELDKRDKQGPRPPRERSKG